MTGGTFGLAGPWQDALQRITNMMTQGVDLSELVLPEGFGSKLAMERYAREYVKAHPRSDLAIMYGIAAVGVCVAAQGAWVLEAPIKGGGALEVPAIQHFMGVAPSGWRKSTALDAARKPLLRSLAKGAKHRAEISARMRTPMERRAREDIEPGGPAFDAKQFATIFNAGICPHTMLKDPTMEALRDFMVTNGGLAAVWSAEADVYRNIAAYSNDAGTLTFLLDGWSQESIETARVSRGMITIDSATLLQCVLFQTDVFAEVTGGAGARATGADSFISRGVFGRVWVVRATETGGFEALADDYADDNDFTASGLDGMELGDGERTPLGWATVDYEANLDMLVEESDEYRALKAMRREWEKARAEHGTGLQVPEIRPMDRHRIHMNADARLAYRRVQRLQLGIEAALHADNVDEDVRTVFTPLAARVTQHVLREALVMALGSEYRTVTGEMITDAATRILPWRIAHTADALLMRADEMAMDQIARVITENPRMESRTAMSLVLKVIARLAYDMPPNQREYGVRHDDISREVRELLPKRQQTGVGDLVDRTLADLVGSPDSRVRLAALPPDAPLTAKRDRYCIEERAMMRLLGRAVG